MGLTQGARVPGTAREARAYPNRGEEMNLIPRTRQIAYKPQPGAATKEKPVVAATISLSTIIAVATAAVDLGLKVAGFIRDWRKSKQVPVKPVSYEEEQDK